jgi:hypothetical protein
LLIQLNPTRYSLSRQTFTRPEVFLTRSDVD